MERTRRLACGAVLIAAMMAALMAAEARAADSIDVLQRATDDAIAKICAELRKSNPDIKNVAVLPLLDDDVDGYATEALRSAVVKTQLGVFTRDDRLWDALLGEIEWDTRREDIMNAETVQKFGRIEGVQAIVYGKVWNRWVNMWGLHARVKVSVNVSEVETGRHLCGIGPVEGEAYIHWSDALTHFWRYPLMAVIVLAALVVVALVVRAIKKALRPV